MAETPNSSTPSSKDSAAVAAETARAAADAGARVAEATTRQAKDGARAAEAVAEKTVEASHAATKANSEILRTQLETAQEAVRSSIEASMRSLEGMTQNWTRAFGGAASNPDLAEQSARNVQAVSQASTALAKGAKDASQAWFELTQRAVRTNLEAFGQLAGCRSVQEVMALHSTLLRDNLQQCIEGGEAIARASTDAIHEATRAIQVQPRV